MKTLWKWSKGRQDTGYDKFTLLFSKLFRCDAYILRIPTNVGIPKHTDPVPNAEHHRVNITVFGHLQMETDSAVFRIGSWYSYFRPDIVVHWAEPVKKTTYILSFGWLR